MDLNNKRTVWILAIFAVTVLWGISAISMGYSAKFLDANGMVFTCCSFIAAAWSLLLYAGHGELSRETLRSIDTWGYGIVLILSSLILFAVFYFVSPTEGVFILRTSVVAGLIGGWFFLSRAVGVLQILGSIIILAGILWVCFGIAEESQVAVLGLIFLYAFLQSARIFIAEFHKTHNAAARRAGNLKTRCRVVAYVMLVVAIMFLLLSLIGATIHAQTGHFIINGMPELSDFRNPAAIIAGLLTGSLLIAPVRLIEFTSSHKIKTENYLALGAIAPFATLLIEWITEPITGLPLQEFTQSDFLAGIAITMGGILVAFGGARGDKKNPDFVNYLIHMPKNSVSVIDSHEIVTNSIEHFDGDMIKAAKALGVSTTSVSAFNDDRKKVLAFKNMPDVARNYRQEIAGKDYLTGLINKANFMSSLKIALSKDEEFSILYLDLDKFKPVNDDHGHEAGDEILRSVAIRLQETCSDDAIITRMGGDEYCVLLPNANKAAATKKAKEIQKIIAVPFSVDSVDNDIEIGASVGVSSYPTDGKTAEKLISMADGGMYSSKNSRGK